MDAQCMISDVVVTSDELGYEGAQIIDISNASAGNVDECLLNKAEVVEYDIPEDGHQFTVSSRLEETSTDILDDLENGRVWTEEVAKQQRPPKTRRQSCKPIECPDCEYQCSRVRLLDEHIRKQHAGKHPYSCTQCDYRTASQTLLQQHVTKSHPDRVTTYSCKHCDYTSNRQSVVKDHSITHHDDEKIQVLYSCRFCKYQSFRHTSVKRHEINHSGKKRFRCDLCRFANNESHNLKQHFIIHHKGVHPYRCGKKDCEFRTSFFSDLTHHKTIYSHDGEDETSSDVGQDETSSDVGQTDENASFREEENSKHKEDENNSFREDMNVTRKDDENNPFWEDENIVESARTTSENSPLQCNSPAPASSATYSTPTLSENVRSSGSGHQRKFNGFQDMFENFLEEFSF